MPQEQGHSHHKAGGDYGHPMQRLLQGVAGTSDGLLMDCVRAREDLGVAKTRILRARERERDREARQATRARPTPPSAVVVLQGDDGRWVERGGSSSGDGGGGGGGGGGDGGDPGTGTGGGRRREYGWSGAAAGERGEVGEEEVAAMAAALPAAREFADKMAELAAVVPGLSKSLVDLTAVRLAIHIPVPGPFMPGLVLFFVPRLLIEDRHRQGACRFHLMMK